MDPQRILFIAEGQLGDLLLLTPALRATKESFPHSVVTVLVVLRRNGDATKPNPFEDLTATHVERESSVLSTNRNVDELLVLDRQLLRSLHGVARAKAEYSVVQFLRRMKHDTVVCTFPEDRFTLWAFCSGAPVRVGQRRQGLHRLLTHTPDIMKSDRGVLEYYCGMVKQLGATVKSAKTDYVVPDSAKTWADGFLRSRNIPTDRPLVAVHPGASAEYKMWPPENFSALIEHLVRQNGVNVLLVRGSTDGRVVAAIKQRLCVPIVEVDTGVNVGNLAAILQRCALCISHDSGPRHLAIAVGTPSLALFRQHPEIWKEWSVYEEGAHISTLKGTGVCPVCPPGICLEQIPAGEQFGSHCI